MTHPDMRLVSVERLREMTPELSAEFANIDGPWSRGAMGPDDVWSVLLQAQLDAIAAAPHQPQPAAREEAPAEAVSPFMYAYEEVDQPGTWRTFRQQIKRADGSICPGRPLYTHPASSQQPADDKLRLAVEAFSVITSLSVNLRHGGPDTSDLNDLSDAFDTAVDVAAEALAALKAEGKK